MKGVVEESFSLTLVVATSLIVLVLLGWQVEVVQELAEKGNMYIILRRLNHLINAMPPGSCVKIPPCLSNINTTELANLTVKGDWLCKVQGK